MNCMSSIAATSASVLPSPTYPKRLLSCVGCMSDRAAVAIIALVVVRRRNTRESAVAIEYDERV